MRPQRRPGLLRIELLVCMHAEGPRTEVPTRYLVNLEGRSRD
jgi:hypothetical protein